MTKLAIAALFAALLLLGYHVLEGVMGLGQSENVTVETLNLTELLGEGAFSWIDAIPVGAIQLGLRYLTDLPLYVLLFGLSGLLFLAHFIFPKK